MALTKTKKEVYNPGTTYYRFAMPETAFEDFYHAFKDKVYTHVFYRVGTNADLAADLTSEIFLRAFRNHSRYDHTHAYSTWIFTITRNVIVDHYRRQRDTRDIADYAETLESDDAVVSDVLDRELDLAWLEEAVAQLPEKQKHHLSQRFFAGKSVRAIAQDCGASQDAVRKNIQRATTSLIQSHKKRYV